MAEHPTAAARGAPRVAVATSVQGLEGAVVELIELNSEGHSDWVLLRFCDTDAGVSLIGDHATVWALIVEADRQLARLTDQRRPQ